jgi:hypothetical protein
MSNVRPRKKSSCNQLAQSRMLNALWREMHIGGSAHQEPRTPAVVNAGRFPSGSHISNYRSAPRPTERLRSGSHERRDRKVQSRQPKKSVSQERFGPACCAAQPESPTPLKRQAVATRPERPVRARSCSRYPPVVMQTHKQAEVSPRRAWPNPSIERTPKSMARQGSVVYCSPCRAMLSVASHVKR